VICSDKTGTLTQNAMTVVQAWSGGKALRLTGEGYNPAGQFFRATHPFDARGDADTALLLQGALLCNDARLEESCDEAGKASWQIIGDPTEAALAVAAAKAGWQREELARQWPRVQEIPFDSDRKRMSTLHRTPTQELLAFVKGAPDVILDLCTRQLQDGSRCRSRRSCARRSCARTAPWPAMRCACWRWRTGRSRRCPNSPRRTKSSATSCSSACWA
jgi:Ca2+-transporting ATPase